MTPVEICNLALGLIGQKRISSLDDASVSAERCSDFFWPDARAALERRAWMFATERLTLEPGTETGDARWPRLFVLPATVVRVLGADDGSGEWTARHMREGQTLLTEQDLDRVYIRAVVDSNDTARWSPNFVRAVALLLASDLAGPLTENARLADSLEAKYELAVKITGTLDGMQGSSERRQSGPCAGARR